MGDVRLLFLCSPRIRSWWSRARSQQDTCGPGECDCRVGGHRQDCDCVWAWPTLLWGSASRGLGEGPCRLHLTLVAERQADGLLPISALCLLYAPGGAPGQPRRGTRSFEFHMVASFFLSLVYCNIRRVFIYLILYSVITMVGIANIKDRCNPWCCSGPYFFSLDKIIL